MSDMRVWGIGTTRTFRVHFALIERGFDYETVPIRTRTDDQKRADFRAVAVSGKVPAFQDGDRTLSESAAITNYVLRKGRQPRSVQHQAIVDQWSYFIAMELDATALYVVRRHEGLPEVYGAAPEAVTAAKDYFDRQLRALDRELLGQHQWALGDEFCEVDILLTSMLDWAGFSKLAIPQRAEEYHSRVRQRPAYRRAYEHNYGRAAKA